MKDSLRGSQIPNFFIQKEQNIDLEKSKEF